MTGGHKLWPHLIDTTQWRNFLEVINKAMLSCENAGISISNHFAKVSKMIDLGKGAKRPIEYYMLTFATNGPMNIQVIYILYL